MLNIILEYSADLHIGEVEDLNGPFPASAYNCTA